MGFRFLECVDYVSAVGKLDPDVAVSMPDLPHQKPGKNRSPKMVARTELWLKELLRRNREWALAARGDGAAEKVAEEPLGEEDSVDDSVESELQRGRTPIFAPLLPLDIDEQRLYVDFLATHASSLSGLAIYDLAVLRQLIHSDNLPLEDQGILNLPRMLLSEPASSPMKILEQVEAGVDLFHANMVVEATDGGIALDFHFPGGGAQDGKEKKLLGMDMWNPIYATDLGPLSYGLGGGDVSKNGEKIEEKCGCYACKCHHRAYVQHLLTSKEMTGWVLLQM